MSEKVENNNGYYSDNLEHIYEEILLVNLIVNLSVLRFRENIQESENVLSLLKGSPIGIEWASKNQFSMNDDKQLVDAIKELSNSIAHKIQNSKNNGTILKLDIITTIFELTSKEYNMLLFCLAPEFDSRYQKLYSYLHNDANKKNPTVELLLNFSCDNYKEKLQSRKFFSKSSPLIKNNILEFIQEKNNLIKPLISQELKVNERIVNYILNNDEIDEDIRDMSEVLDPSMNRNEIILPEKYKKQIDDFINFYNTNEHVENFIFSFYGPYGSEKIDTAFEISNSLGFPLIVFDLLSLYHSNLLFEAGLELIFREHKLKPAILYFKNCDFIFKDETVTHLKKFLLNRLNKDSWLSFLDSTESLPIHGEFKKQRVISIEFPIPEYKIRKQLWETYLKDHKISDDTDIKELANKYNLTGGQIKDIISTASTYAMWRDASNISIRQSDIIDACHVHSNQKISQMAIRIKPKHVWDDLILEESDKRKLEMLVNMFKYKHIVYDEWGFDDKLSLGKGISALFYGDPGTGKTLAAEIIANELSMDMYKVDIAAVVSKYVGETEKNLDIIFNEARISNCILFFDEADSLFGKRTVIKDSHDRYANVEVSYLLQKIDEYQGMVIMATNFSSNLDSAFERRLHFTIKFMFPDENSRLLIWKNVFPGKTPLAEDIDFQFLAKNITISGGNIKNIALTSAFYLAESRESGKLGMEHILKACKYEYEKMGRLWDEQYFKMFSK